MPVYYTWWQTLLNVANLALVLGGIFGLLGALYYLIRGRPYPPNRHPGRMAIVSLILLALGLLSFALMGELLTPRQGSF